MSPLQKSDPFFSKRRVTLAGLAAFVACAACCALPLLAVAGVGGTSAGLFAAALRPGAELLVGVGVFVAVLGVMAIARRLRSRGASSCGTACSADGGCCHRGTAP